MVIGVLAPLLAAVWLGASPDVAALPGPVAWQEPAPLARLFLQLPFEAPEPMPAGRLGIDASLRYSNSLLLAENDRIAVETDVETAAPSLLLRAGLVPGLEVQLQLAFVVDVGGFLDRPIEVVEGAFHGDNPQRAGRPRDTSTWRLVRPGEQGIVHRGGGSGLADPWLGVKVRVATEEGARPAVSLRAALALPVARPPYGAGILTPALGAMAAWTRDDLAVRLEADLAFPTARLAEVDVATRPYAAMQAGLTWLSTGWLALQLQVSAHSSPLVGTGLPQLDDPCFYVLAGVTMQGRGWPAVDLGVVENVWSPYRGADLAFVLAVRAGR